MSCWGANEAGEVGDTLPSSSPVARRVSGVQATAIALGARHTCALTRAGDVVCWGAADQGQLGSWPGDDKCAGARCTGADAGAGGGAVLALRGASAVAAGGDATCAIGLDRRLRCWGRAPHGRTSLRGHDESRGPAGRHAGGRERHPRSAPCRAWGGVACLGTERRRRARRRLLRRIMPILVDADGAHDPCRRRSPSGAPTRAPSSGMRTRPLLGEPTRAWPALRRDDEASQRRRSGQRNVRGPGARRRRGRHLWSLPGRRRALLGGEIFIAEDAGAEFAGPHRGALVARTGGPRGDRAPARGHAPSHGRPTSGRDVGPSAWASRMP